jgi:ribosomal protein L37AE/L43A
MHGIIKRIRLFKMKPKYPKKCPCCNSTRLEALVGGFECKKCGFVNIKENK